MAYLSTLRRQTSGGGGQSLAWALDSFTETDPFTSGLALSISNTPIDVDAILVWSQGLILHPDDWNYDAGNNQIIILFSGNPAIDNPESGEWNFLVQYPYTVV